MLVLVFVGLADILLGPLVERLLAAHGAEVVGLSFILRRAGCSRGVDIHAADGIMYCVSHMF